ncbi:hypothetical protein U1Q18_031813 [Sarracenia purpurea var. burkii]
MERFPSWAVDRGHLNIIELLVAKNADDNEGQGPLHYAAVCDREAIVKFLVKQNARTDLKDNDGNTPYDLDDMKWPWLQNAVADPANMIEILFSVLLRT